MKSFQSVSRYLAFGRSIPGFRAWNRLLYKREIKGWERDLFGLHFRHPVGIAAGFDRQGSLVNEWSDLGYSFVCIRIDPDRIRSAVGHLLRRDPGTVVAAELVSSSQDETGLKDEIVRSFSLLYDFVDLFVVHLSGPAGMSSMDDVSGLADVLDELLGIRLCYEKEIPIVVRISDSLSQEQMASVLDYCMLSGIDGIAVSNVRQAAQVVERCGGRLPVIGFGAFPSPEEVLSLLRGGASLVGLESGFSSCGRPAARKMLKILKKQLSHS